MLTPHEIAQANGPVTLRSLVATPTHELRIVPCLRPFVVDGVRVLAYTEAGALRIVRNTK